jgi:D-serine deaminase-like pyridoxal phosphate-dependent protein
VGGIAGRDAFAGAVGKEPERVVLGEIASVDREVAGIRVYGRTSPPEQEAPDAPQVRDQLDSQVGAQLEHDRRRLDPLGGRDEVLALRRGRQLGGVEGTRDGRSIFGGHRCHHRKPMKVDDLPTPALVVDSDAFEANLQTMAAALPGARLRPHVKAHKCTALAARQAAVGHHNFTCATPREVVGMAAAGLGADLLLANETVDAQRLRAMADTDAYVTVAVDSDDTIEAAAQNGITHVLIDVNVGLPRCGCPVDDAGRLADNARARGLDVRGVMGYEGHVYAFTDRDDRANATQEAMTQLLRAHTKVGGDIVSAGATGTYDLNRWATEIQAGSYALMDTAFAPMIPAFAPALSILATVISVAPKHAVADCGLKALGMDHGNPSIDDADVWLVSDEHVTFRPNSPTHVGDRIRVWPAHVDPTVAYHDRMYVARDGEVIDEWAVDLRGW